MRRIGIQGNRSVEPGNGIRQIAIEMAQVNGRQGQHDRIVRRQLHRQMGETHGLGCLRGFISIQPLSLQSMIQSARRA
jgi:hypothetical protein